MKTKLLAILAIIVIFFSSCKDVKNKSDIKEKEENTIEFSKVFFDKTDLVLSKDTLKKTIKYKFRNYEIPLDVTLLSGLDKESCNRVAYFKIKTDKQLGKVDVLNLSAGLIPCAMEFENGETIDTTKFESAVVNIKLKVKEGIKTYNFNGSIGQITSLGVYKNF